MTRAVPDPRAEALLYLEWARAAAGRFWAAEESPLANAGAPSAAAAAPAVRPGAVEGAGTAGPGPRAASAVEVARARPEAIPALPAVEDEEGAWERLVEDALACRRCGLCETRTHVVFGEGHRRPRLLVVGEAPGADEDASGRPFVGKAGQLLTRMLGAIGLERADVFIANVLKCRPPGNRAPGPDEVAACRPYLVEQVRLLRPELLLLLGNHATRAVLGTDRGITSLRGQIHRTPEGLPALPTFHPAYLLRNPEAKREAWIDLQLAARTLGLSIPRKSNDAPTGSTEASGVDA